MPARLPVVLGSLLPFLAVGVGLLVPRSDVSGVLIPAMFVASGALIGRWWAFVPSLSVVVGLNLAELVGSTSRIGAAIELHAGGFDLGFLLATSAVAIALPLAGAATRMAVSEVRRRLT
jgi:hypothetical protein